MPRARAIRLATCSYDFHKQTLWFDWSVLTESRLLLKREYKDSTQHRQFTLKKPTNQHHDHSETKRILRQIIINHDTNDKIQGTDFLKKKTCIYLSSHHVFLAEKSLLGNREEIGSSQRQRSSNFPLSPFSKLAKKKLYSVI